MEFIFAIVDRRLKYAKISHCINYLLYGTLIKRCLYINLICDQSVNIYIIACPLNTTLSSISTQDIGIPCHLTSLCTGLECCLHAEKLDRDFHIQVIVDPCLFVVSIGIDNYVHNQSLSKYSLGRYYQPNISSQLQSH